MLTPFRPLFDPATDEIDLVPSQLLAGPGRRHTLSLGVSADASQESAFAWILRCDHPIAAAVGKDSFPSIQPQVYLALSLIGAMASETVIRQDRPNVAVELNTRQVCVLARQWIYC